MFGLLLVCDLACMVSLSCLFESNSIFTDKLPGFHQTNSKEIFCQCLVLIINIGYTKIVMSKILNKI